MDNTEIVFVYLGLSLLSIIVAAFIFKWVFGFDNFTKRQDALYHTVVQIAKKAGVDDDVLKKINEAFNK